MTDGISRRGFIGATAAASVGLSAASSMNTNLAAAAEPNTEMTGLRIHPNPSTVMTGTPPRSEDIVTIENAQSSREKHRWSLRNARELMPTQRISRGRGPVCPLPRAGMPVKQFNNLQFKDWSGKQTTIAEFLESQHTDAFLVMVNGKIVNEQYFGGMDPDQPHDLYSAGKSLCSTMIGTMLGDELQEEALIESYLPELAGKAISGATIGQLLDMKSGLDYRYGAAEDFELTHHMNMTHGTKSGATPQSQWELLLDAKKSMARHHGGPMKYKEFDVLAVVLAAERASKTQFADLFSERIWSKLGVEHDAYVRCDGRGTAVPSFGMCTTLRDAARWSQMCLQDGNINGTQIVPQSYLASVRAGKDKVVPLKEWISGDIDVKQSPGTAYCKWFWFPGVTEDSIAASGGLGQFFYINSRYKTVITTFSCWNIGDDFETLEQSYWHGFEQISKTLHERRG